MTEDGRTEDGRTEDGKWKIVQCSVGPETAKTGLCKLCGATSNGVLVAIMVPGGCY